MTQQGRASADPSTSSLPEKILAIHGALAVAKIPHAFGGAIALAYYAEPRATIDIDVNIFVGTERWRDVVEVLAPLGVDAKDLDPAALELDRQCRLWWEHNAVDLFFAHDPIHQAMRKETRRVPFAGASISILGPEHLAVCKAVFDRRKDWLDIEQMLISVEELNLMEIEGWLERMVSPNDLRLQRLSELATALFPNL